MNPSQKEFNSIIWRFVREGVALFLVFVAGWALTAFLLLGLFTAAISQLPLWLGVPVGLGTPLLGGAAAALLWWRWGRRAAKHLASLLGVPRPNPLSGMPDALGCFFLVSLGMTLIGLVPMAYGLNEFIYHRWLGSFRAADATVTGARIDEVEGGGLKGLAPRVLYEFRVGDELHAGYKIHWELQFPDEGGPPPSDSVIWDRGESARNTLTDLLGRYPAGKKVTAYYDPDDPGNACLVYVPFELTRHGSGLWFVLAVVVTLWLIFAVARWVVSRPPAPVGQS